MPDGTTYLKAKQHNRQSNTRRGTRRHTARRNRTQNNTAKCADELRHVCLFVCLCVCLRRTRAARSRRTAARSSHTCESYARQSDRRGLMPHASGCSQRHRQWPVCLSQPLAIHRTYSTACALQRLGYSRTIAVSYGAVHRTRSLRQKALSVGRPVSALQQRSDALSTRSAAQRSAAQSVEGID